jgi:hypothetical protein
MRDRRMFLTAGMFLTMGGWVVVDGRRMCMSGGGQCGDR